MNINDLASSIATQADKLFPTRTDTSMFLKIYHETAELIDANEDPAKRSDELADLLILLLDYGARKDIDIQMAVQRKMAINQNRKWVTNQLGVNQHVK